MSRQRVRGKPPIPMNFSTGELSLSMNGEKRTLAIGDKWRALVLVTDAFGSHGGIARFNQDFLVSLSTHPRCREVVAYPRLVSHPLNGELPKRLTFDVRGAGNKARYIGTITKDFFLDRDYDFIVCGHINLLSLGFALSKIANCPLVLIVHGIDAWTPTRSMLVNSLTRRVSAVVAVSELTMKRLVEWSRVDPSKGIVLPNCVDLAAFQPGPKNPALVARYGLGGRTVILTLGRLASQERQKGFDEVIEALPHLRNHIPNVSYLIAGVGPDRARLERKAQSLGVHDRIVFTGMVPEAEKADHYRLADAFVMPSRGEGFGIVLLEAMACGVPIVASKLDGGREALRNGLLGTLVNPEDPEDIKRGILEALRKPGTPPEGLAYFSSASYQNRVHGIVDSILTG